MKIAFHEYHRTVKLETSSSLCCLLKTNRGHSLIYAWKKSRVQTQIRNISCKNSIFNNYGVLLGLCPMPGKAFISWHSPACNFEFVYSKFVWHWWMLILPSFDDRQLGTLNWSREKDCSCHWVAGEFDLFENFISCSHQKYFFRLFGDWKNIHFSTIFYLGSWTEAVLEGSEGGETTWSGKYCCPDKTWYNII